SSLPPGTPPGSCGVEGPTHIQNHIIDAGSGVYLMSCSGGVPPGKTGLAHGLGHVLGLGAHTASGSDLMGTPLSTFTLSPLLSEVMLFLYGVAPGTVIP